MYELTCPIRYLTFLYIGFVIDVIRFLATTHGTSESPSPSECSTTTAATKDDEAGDVKQSWLEAFIAAGIR